jgi:TetR/AcrR family transcriptional repressor of bet genes
MRDAIKPGPEASKPPRTASREVRRAQLIAATIDAIAEHGIAGTTLSTVTEKAGLSIGIVNFHFQSKQNLFEETLTFLAREHHEQWHRAHADAGLSAGDKLLAIVDAHFDPRICTPKKLAVWFAFYGEAGRRSAYRRLIDDIDDERFELSKGLCTDIDAEGGYRGAAPEMVAQTLEGLYDGLCLNILMYPAQFTRKLARLQVRQYLAGMYPDHFSAKTS